MVTYHKGKCRACGKIGRLKCMCKSTRTQGTVKTVEDTSTTVTEQYQMYVMYQLEDATNMPKATEHSYVITLTVEGRE